MCWERRIYVSCIGTEAKVPGTDAYCYRERKYSRERKFHVTFAPRSESSRERKFQGAKVPPMVLSLLGAKVRGNESCIIHGKVLNESCPQTSNKYAYTPFLYNTDEFVVLLNSIRFMHHHAHLHRVSITGHRLHHMCGSLFESKSSFWAKNRIEIDRKSKFGNRNITISVFARSLATMNSSRRKVCCCVGIILFDSNLPVLLSAVGVVKYRCTVL